MEEADPPPLERDVVASEEHGLRRGVLGFDPVPQRVPDRPREVLVRVRGTQFRAERRPHVEHRAHAQDAVRRIDGPGHPEPALGLEVVRRRATVAKRQERVLPVERPLGVEPELAQPPDRVVALAHGGDVLPDRLVARERDGGDHVVDHVRPLAALEGHANALDDRMRLDVEQHAPDRNVRAAGPQRLGGVAERLVVEIAAVSERDVGRVQRPPELGGRGLLLAEVLGEEPRHRLRVGIGRALDVEDVGEPDRLERGRER